MTPKKHKRTDCLCAFLNHEGETLRNTGHISLATHYESTSRSVRRYLLTCGKSDISLCSLDAARVEDYEAWLYDQGLCKNTSSFYMRILQSAYSRAVHRGQITDRHPFDGVYRGIAKTSKRAVSMTDIRQLQDLDIRSNLLATGYREGSRRLQKRLFRLELARDIFLFCFCARGLSFVDLAFMRKTDIRGNTIVYYRRKTGQRLEVNIEPLMQSIIERYHSDSPYLFPILHDEDDSTQMYKHYRSGISHYNSSLTMLSRMLDGVKLTSYTSRHTWASLAYHLHIPLSVISQSLGHESEHTTEIYLKSLDPSVINLANQQLLNNVFNTTK